MPLADHLSALPRIRHLIHIRHLVHLSLLTLLSPRPGPGQTSDRTHITTASTKELTMRINPSDVLFLILSCFTLLAGALVIGGLAAHPFAG